MRPLGLGHFTFLHLAPQEFVRVARGAGFGFVGLRFHPVAPGMPHWLPDRAQLLALQGTLQDEGLEVYDIETVVIDARLDPEDLRPMMDAAATLGAERINVCADLFNGLEDKFAAICALAGERGMGIDIECMAWRGINTPQACLKLIDKSGAANAGYLLDALHHIRCGGTPESIARIGNIASAQLCDAPGPPPTGTEGLIAEARSGRCPPGAGDLPLRDIAAALPARTRISVEVPSERNSHDEIERAREIFDATAALFSKEPN